MKTHRPIIAISFSLVILWAPLVSHASPSIAVDLTVEISGHNWGIWMVDGVPSHDYMSGAFREASWLNNGSDEDSQPFYSYWALGFGPYGAIYLSNQLALVLLIISVFLIFLKLRKRRSTIRSPKESHADGAETN